MLREKLTNDEFNAIAKLTHETKMDACFDIMHDYESDIDYFVDYENDNKAFSLEDGLHEIVNGLAYPRSHDNMTIKEGKLIGKLFIEFGVADKAFVDWFVK